MRVATTSRWSVANRANIVTGLTVTAYLVPQVMAYSTVAGLPPSAGLWACLPALVAYAVLGTARLLSVGPESSVALMTAAVVAPIAAGDAERFPVLAAALALAVAGVCLVASVLRFAFIADLLSRPVLLGYMTGIAVLMIMGQLDALLGIPVTGDSILAELRSVASSWTEISVPDVLIGAGVFVSVAVLARWPRLPGPLIGIVAGAALVGASGLSVALVGEIPTGLPAPDVPTVSWEEAQLLVLGALGVSVVAFADTTLTARAFREWGEPEIDATTELRALAAANAGAGLFQGMAVSSSGSRTALAKAGGATSQGYSLVVVGMLALVLLLAGPLLSEMPKSALAGLVVYAAIRLVDVKELRWLWGFRRMEFALAAFTCLGVLFLGVLYGVLAAVGVSVAELLSRVARPNAAALGFVPGLAGMHDVDDFPEAQEEPGLLVFRYDSPLFFANAVDFRRRALRMVDQRQPGLRWMAINCEAIIEIDSTAVEALEELRRDLGQRQITLTLVRAKQDLVEALRPTGFIDRLGRDRVFPTLPTLVAAYRADTGTG